MDHKKKGLQYRLANRINGWKMRGSPYEYPLIGVLGACMIGVKIAFSRPKYCHEIYLLLVIVLRKIETNGL